MLTIIIAPNLREARAELHDRRSSLNRPAQNMIALPVASALRELEGHRPDEIVIVRGSEWHTTRPGEVTNLWWYINALSVRHGTKIEWAGR